MIKFKIVAPLFRIIAATEKNNGKKSRSSRKLL